MLKEELNSGRIDLAFLMTDGITFKDVNVRMLKAEELILVAGPKHPFCLKEKIVLEDLQKQTLLIPKTDCSYRKAFERSLEKQGIVPRILYFSSIIGLRNCLKKGIGLTLCPKIAVNSELKRGRLVELSWDVKSIETSVLMIWHTEKWCSPLLSQFMYFAEEVITP
jgi:DNA-binding transcriptional LysR family regulator